MHRLKNCGLPQLLVYNKLDSLDPDQRPRELVDQLLRGDGAAEPTPRVFVSALSGEGLAELRALIAQAMQGAQTPADTPDHEAQLSIHE